MAPRRSDDDPRLGTVPAALPGFQVNSPAELFGGFNGAGIGGGIRIANGEALLIPHGLSEHTSQFHFASMGRQALVLALPAHGLLLHHRDARSVHLDV